MDMILGLIRHVLTYGGGYLTAQGLASDSEITAGVSAVITLVGLAWSIIDKKRKEV